MIGKQRRAAAAALAAVAALAAGLGCRAAAPAGPGAELGILVEGVQLLADGDLAKLSYRVVDFETARTALREEMVLVGEDASRPMRILSMGRLGPMRQRPSATGKLQFVMFSNPGRALRSGSTATLIVGGTCIPSIPVS